MPPLVRVKFGSHLYGTSTPESDQDFKSVHLPSAEDILLQRVKGVVSTGTKSDSTRKNSAEDVDDEPFALHKFLGLAAQGDMMATELLFALRESWTDWSDFWVDDVLPHRHVILNRQCAGFVGYCRKQAAKYGIKGSRVACARNALNLLDSWPRDERLGSKENLIEQFVSCHDHTSIVDLPAKGRDGVLLHWEVCGRKLPFTVRVAEAREIVQRLVDNYGPRALAAEQNQGVDWKAVSHAVRAAEQSIELLTTGRITSPRPNAAELLKIKRGEIPYRVVAAELESLLDRVENESSRSALPSESDQDLIDSIVFDLYSYVVFDKLT